MWGTKLDISDCSWSVERLSSRGLHLCSLEGPIRLALGAGARAGAALLRDLSPNAVVLVQYLHNLLFMGQDPNQGPGPPAVILCLCEAIAMVCGACELEPGNPPPPNRASIC